MSTPTRSGRPAIPADAFEHGDVRRYHRGCRCTPCTTSASREARKNHYLRLTGRGTQRTADRAADRIRRLRIAGLSDADIQAAAGIAPHTMYRILRSQPIHIRTEQRILAVPVPAPTGEPTRCRARIDATGTVRRVRALAAAGWYIAETARRLDRHKQYIEAIANGRTGNAVTLHIAATVAGLYEEIAHQRPEDHGLAPGLITRSRRLAAAKGWPDPVFWEDYGGIDDPDAPETATEGGTPRYVALSEDAQWLMSAGYSLEHAAQRLGVTRAYLDQCIRRYRLAQQQALKEAA